MILLLESKQNNHTTIGKRLKVKTLKVLKNVGLHTKNWERNLQN